MNPPPYPTFLDGTYIPTDARTGLHRKDVDALLALIKEGDQLECLGNTYAPTRQGLVLTVARPGKSVINGIAPDDKGTRGPYRMTLPLKASAWRITPDNRVFNHDLFVGHSGGFTAAAR